MWINIWRDTLEETKAVHMTRFIGRKGELTQLEALQDKRSASMIVVRGRRRIGKSRLLEEFGKKIRNIFLTGLPPSNATTKESQRQEFVRQLERAGIPGISPDDWGNMLWHLSKHTEKGRVLIVLDEISWMGGKDPEFLGKLKTAWDMYFSKNSKLIFAICGSISSWIEENILSNTGFLGRITLDLILEELPLSVCSAFWCPREKRICPYEKFKILSVTGGVPLYLEQINPKLSAEQNLQKLCFSRGGLLVREFSDIFSDLFSRRSSSYKDIVTKLVSGPKELGEICKNLDQSQGGTRSQYLDDLIKAGFVKRDFTWLLKSCKESKLSRYRLSDNYLRFYLKHIAPNRSKIDSGYFDLSSLTKLAGWASTMGLQFENLVLHNHKIIWEQLGITPQEIIMDGPFFQTSTSKQPGCQIDYLIHTRFHTLYLCEIKFSKNSLHQDVVKEVEEKRKRLKIPKYCSIRPVLIHVNGVDESVYDQMYFDSIINFGALFD